VPTTPRAVPPPRRGSVLTGPARLEPWGADDLPLLEKLLGDPAMMGYLGGPESPTKIRERQARYERRGSRQFKVIDRAAGDGVGWVGYWERDWRDHPVYETGWSIIPAFQGRGLAADASAQLISRAAAERRRRFMHAFPSLDNEASNAICRKLGFELLEQLEFEYPPGSGRVTRTNDWRFDLESVR
jgi:RimJ/RimL family protein N-acetyltransferase